MNIAEFVCSRKCPQHRQEYGACDGKRVHNTVNKSCASLRPVAKALRDVTAMTRSLLAADWPCSSLSCCTTTLLTSCLASQRLPRAFQQHLSITARHPLQHQAVPCIAILGHLAGGQQVHYFCTGTECHQAACFHTEQAMQQLIYL